ncbi:MAG: TolC family protein [Deltaproteobacteria bacterium]|nr:TolC family protein [Deltaproteobacteria bacterium]
MPRLAPALGWIFAVGGSLVSSVGTAQPAQSDTSVARELASPQERTDTLAPTAVTEAVLRVLPQLMAAQAERDGADAEFLAAEGGFDPQLAVRAMFYPVGYYRYATADAEVQQATALWGMSLYAGYRLGTGLVPGSANVPSYYGERQTNGYGEVRAGLRIPILRDGSIDRRRANVQSRSVGRDSAEAELSRVQIESVRASTIRYWDWVSAGQKRQIAGALLRVAEQRNSGLDARVRAGDLARYEWLDNSRVVLAREASVVAAERALQTSAVELSLFFRDPQGAPIVVPPSRLPQELPPVDPSYSAWASHNDRLGEAMAARPELRRLDVQRAQAQIELDFARNQALPQVDLVAQVSQDFGPMAGTSDTRGLFEVSAGVNVQIPLVMRAQIGRIRAAEAALARVTALRGAARDRVIADVRAGVFALQAAIERAAIASREYELAQQVEAAERERFAQGDSTIFLVNQREQTTAEAAQRRIDALADWQRARAMFVAAMGQR